MHLISKKKSKISRATSLKFHLGRQPVACLIEQIGSFVECVLPFRVRVVLADRLVRYTVDVHLQNGMFAIMPVPSLGNSCEAPDHRL